MRVWWVSKGFKALRGAWGFNRSYQKVDDMQSGILCLCIFERSP